VNAYSSLSLYVCVCVCMCVYMCTAVVHMRHTSVLVLLIFFYIVISQKTMERAERSGKEHIPVFKLVDETKKTVWFRVLMMMLMMMMMMMMCVCSIMCVVSFCPFSIFPSFLCCCTVLFSFSFFFSFFFSFLLVSLLAITDLGRELCLVPQVQSNVRAQSIG
jgi:hypothetical protein